jgi:hypothetical protein
VLRLFVFVDSACVAADNGRTGQGVIEIPSGKAVYEVRSDISVGGLRSYETSRSVLELPSGKLLAKAADTPDKTFVKVKMWAHGDVICDVEKHLGQSMNGTFNRIRMYPVLVEAQQFRTKIRKHCDNCIK